MFCFPTTYQFIALVLQYMLAFSCILASQIDTSRQGVFPSTPIVPSTSNSYIEPLNFTSDFFVVMEGGTYLFSLTSYNLCIIGFSHGRVITGTYSCVQYSAS
ncbi:hypothetical protein F4823DRAFT_586184 [Ustulina deusta]|nr:hypothetical protein F4823DRAFT_586184 [Ustulina deusta]